MPKRNGRTWTATILAGAVSLALAAIDPDPGPRAQGSRAGVPTIVATASSKGPLMLLPDPVEVHLRPTESASAAMGRGTRIFLVLEGVRAKAQPGILYTVHLLPPTGTAPNGGQGMGGKVGTLNLFAAAEAARTYSYDVTEAMKALGLRRAVADGATVVFVPSGIPATGSAPQVARVALVAQ